MHQMEGKCSARELRWCLSCHSLKWMCLSAINWESHKIASHAYNTYEQHTPPLTLSIPVLERNRDKILLGTIVTHKCQPLTVIIWSGKKFEWTLKSRPNCVPQINHFVCQDVCNEQRSLWRMREMSCTIEYLNSVRNKGVWSAAPFPRTPWQDLVMSLRVQS